MTDPPQPDATMQWVDLLKKAAASPRNYRGRIAPTPSGPLHIGHGATFLTAARRALEHDGTLILRIEDIDRGRCREEFARSAIDDLRWLGIEWQEGPDIGGPCSPYLQSRRAPLYLAAWRVLNEAGCIYPSKASRREIALSASAPHADSEPIFPPSLRPQTGTGCHLINHPGQSNWRFLVPDGRAISFTDAIRGPQRFVALADFGDFLVWRKEGGPSYELAVVVDDILMRITEVVRGEDLLLSTARQLLLYEALGATPPAFAHTPLVRDANGRRLAKRSGPSMTLSSLRASGASPDELWRPLQKTLA